MTANRPRRPHPSDDNSLLEVFFAGIYTPGSGWMAGRHTRLWRPPTDVFETEAEIVVQLEVAGMRRDDFFIALEERRLTISGSRAHAALPPGAFHQMEINFGEFRSDVDLPAPVLVDRIVAEYEDGFLRVTLPKAQPRRVAIG